MTITTRRLMTVGVMVTGLAGAGRPAAAADAGTPGVSRVRTGSATIATRIQDATEQSKTFRALIEAISASDGIVYVEEGICGRAVRSCLANVTASGPNRILLVKVDTRKADWDLMGSIGHELQHTVEVLGNRKVVNQATLFFFYDRVGQYAGHAFETTAAVEAGNAVRAEVRHQTPHADAK